jgi:predicted DNA binding CopG/RHH family protein
VPKKPTSHTFRNPGDFIHPLTQPTVSPAETDTETDTDTSTSTLPSDGVTRRKRGAQAFEKTHERITLWVDKKLKEQFEQRASEMGVSKTVLLNEAIADLLKKHRKATST